MTTPLALAHTSVEVLTGAVILVKEARKDPRGLLLLTRVMLMLAVMYLVGRLHGMGRQQPDEQRLEVDQGAGGQDQPQGAEAVEDEFQARVRENFMAHVKKDPRLYTFSEIVSG